MTETLMSLISISIGIIGTNFVGYIFKTYSLGMVGNTIAGVFGSILLIKALGRLGFGPQSIIRVGEVYYGLLTLNLFAAFIGGVIAMIFIHKLKTKMSG